MAGFMLCTALMLPTSVQATDPDTSRVANPFDEQASPDMDAAVQAIRVLPPNPVFLLTKPPLDTGRDDMDDDNPLPENSAPTK